MTTLVLALFAAFFYSLQSTLLAPYYRRLPPLYIVAFRGIVASSILLPLCLIEQSISDTFSALFFQREIRNTFMLVVVLSMLGNLSIALSILYLPISLAVAFCLSASAVVVAILESVFGLVIVNFELAIVLMVLFVSIYILASLRKRVVVLSLTKGGAASVGFGLCMGCAYFLIADLSRSFPPMAMAFFWELSISLLAIVVSCIAKIKFSGNFLGAFVGPLAYLKMISAEDFTKIFWGSAPGAAGSACFLYATEMGDSVLATALLATQVVFSTLVAGPILGERISGNELVCIVFIAGVIGLLAYV